MTNTELPERVLALLAKHGGWQATLDHITNLESRLAALAGAAPVAWGVTADGVLGFVQVHKAPEFAEQQSKQWGGGAVVPLYRDHAPAKAREVTEADVRKAVAAYNWEHYSGIDICCEDSMRAALATFAEGE